MLAAIARIIRWLILWIIDVCVNINVFSWSLYVWITNLDFSYACEVSECFISSTKRKLKIRTFLSTSEIVIILKTCRFNRSLISFRLDSANVDVKVETSDESTSFCRNTVISAKFWYLSDRRLARMSLMKISDVRFWFSSSDDETVDWTFSDSTSLIDWTSTADSTSDSVRNDLITVLRKSIDSDDNSILQISSSMSKNLNDSVHLSRWLLLSRHINTFEFSDKSWIEITIDSFLSVHLYYGDDTGLNLLIVSMILIL